MTPEEEIKALKEQIAILKEQHRILLDAVDVVSMADGIIQSLKHNDITEAIQKTEYIKNNSIMAMAKSISLNKPFGT